MCLVLDKVDRLVIISSFICPMRISFDFPVPQVWNPAFDVTPASLITAWVGLIFCHNLKSLIFNPKYFYSERPILRDSRLFKNDYIGK